MARKSKEEKRIETLTDAIYKKHGTNVQVPMMSLLTIYDAGKKVAKGGGDDAAVEAAMVAEITRVRLN